MKSKPGASNGFLSLQKSNNASGIGEGNEDLCLRTLNNKPKLEKE